MGSGYRLTRRGRLVVVVLVSAVLVMVAGIVTVNLRPGSTPTADRTAADPPVSPSPTLDPSPAALVAHPLVPATVGETVLIAGSGPGEAAVAAARSLAERAPTVVLVPSTDRVAAAGAWLARRLGAVLLPDTVDAAVLTELGIELVVTVGEAQVPTAVTVPIVGVPFDAAAAWPLRTRPVAFGPGVVDTPLLRVVSAAIDDRPPPGLQVAAAADLLAASIPVEPPSPGPAVLVRSDDIGATLAAATAVAAGYRLVPLGAPDPRADERAPGLLAGTDPEGLVVLSGDGRWTADHLSTLAWQVAVARDGRTLPGGGQLLFPRRRLVALYGAPGSGALGVLGEQPVDAAVDRARELAAAYAPFSEVPVVPAFDLITTVASASAGADGDYSRPIDRGVVERWVEAAGRAGVYVVLDLQPGRTDFLTQAKRYEDLLALPHVGLALDPEWRLGPNQVHLRQIGSVGVDEVNSVATWLAELTRTHRLPQKLLIVHQFQLSMIRDRARMLTPPELSVLVQMDGQGSQAAKLDTYRAVTTLNPPPVWFGWKNFYDEDVPLRSPAETLAVDPAPVYVSYQ